MLPYRTDTRRLLMMVRAFLHEFSEFVAAHDGGLPYPSDPKDPYADHQLEAFLERLAVDATQIDAAAASAEPAIEIQRGLAQHLNDLLSHAPSHRNRIRGQPDDGGAS